MPHTARTFVSLILAPLAALALFGCSDDGGATTTNATTTTSAGDVDAFCTAYTAWFDEPDRTKVDALYEQARPLAPPDIAAILDEVEEARRDERSQDAQDLLGDVADWRAANCPGMATTTTTTAPLTEQALRWCDQWARWLDQRDRPAGPTYLEEALDIAPEAVAERMREYASEVAAEGGDIERLEVQVNSYWHATCPGGVNRPGED